MMICAQCGDENPETHKYCGECAAPLGARLESVREVRKTVTAVFCDLVGSTALGERLDPEALRIVLRRYFEEMRTVIDGHGGHVGKFIGDAVVGVFGIPQVHEDDALRAVRAAVEMRTRLAELNTSLSIESDITLETRTGLCTGEVVVGADDEVVLGDVMNTAARLETAADPGMILIADETYDLVRDAVTAAPVELVLKGKADPVVAWRLVSLVQNVAGHRRRFEQPLVGRERELRRLADLFEQVVSGSELQLVTIVGEPGIGKSRLVAEFDESPDVEAVTRRGQCLSYGDGMGFWPLAEVVKAQLGITETDTEDQVRARLEAGVEGMVDAAWLRARLAPLLGLSGQAADREEVFTAWQRFLDEVAAGGPLVVIVEDLHWADAAMLAFVEHLAEWSSGVPIMVVCTARPELFERHTGWAGGLMNASTVMLQPLGADDTLTLARTLLAGQVGPSGQTAATLVERCAGNPLFAEEYAGLLAERTADDVALQMPDTVQALIAARIDTLPSNRSALLQDAAVIGKVFWADALIAIGDRDRAGVRTDLHDLARKQLVRRSRTSTMPGDEEYTFWHDLVHEVTYNQIPRTTRAEAHRRTAEWMEQTAGDRLAERAELLSHHYTQALELTGHLPGSDPEPLRKAAVHHLATAADRATGLDLDHAVELAREALQLATAEDRERARLLGVLGTSHVLAGEYDQARAALRDARAAAEATGDMDSLGQAYYGESELEFFTGTTRDRDSVLAEAIERLGREPPTGSFALVLASAAYDKLGTGEIAACRDLLGRAIAIAESVGDRSALAAAIDVRGLLGIELDDRAALTDCAAAVEMFAEQGSAFVGMAMSHLGQAELAFNGPADAAPISMDAIAHGVRTRNATYEMDSRVIDLERLADGGAWEELLVAADELIAWAGVHPSWQAGNYAHVAKARVLALRGDLDAARVAISGMALGPRWLESAGSDALSSFALLAVLDGDPQKARRLVGDMKARQIRSWTPLAEICRILIVSGAIQHGRRLVAGAHGPPRLVNNATSSHAQLAEADHDDATAATLYEDAAHRWRGFGNPFELAHALAGHARCLTALGRADDVQRTADEAASIFEALGVRGPALPALLN